MKPFTTDGCSGGMSWAWRLVTGRPPPWEGDCVDHDYEYWQGGPAARRAGADNVLRASVARRGYPKIAWVMWVAVRIGGHPIWPFPWRWGYGKPYRGGYPKWNGKDWT